MSDVKSAPQPRGGEGEKGPLHSVSSRSIDVETADMAPFEDAKFDKKLLLKKDLVLVPLMGVMYMIMFLDRTNIANARIAGLQEGLNMPANGYNIALSIFYIPFVLAEVPSNLILSLSWIKPRWYLGAMMFVLGVVSTCQGLTASYGGLLAVRFLMGIFEASLPAAATYMVSMYYTKREVAVRFAWFFNFALAGPMFSGLLAYAIVTGVDGVGGYEGWRWIFIIEGLMTVGISGVIAALVPNFPEKAQRWFLSDRQKSRLLHLLEASRGKETGSDMAQDANVPLWKVLIDWRIHLFTMCFFCCDVTASAISAFAPTILVELGYESTIAQLMTMPVWASGIVVSFTLTWIASIVNKRYPFILGSILFQIAGWTIMKVYPPQPGVRYLALFFMSMGTFAQMPLLMGWLAANLRGRKYLAVGMAWQVGFGNCANFISSNMFITGERPRYPTGIATGLSFTCFGFVLACTATGLLVWLNKRRESKLENLHGPEREKAEEESLKYVL